ncbi:acylphosphatase [Evansella sp. LMS18]|uniref:acylphosphatase n=1 Tax=Evansella sp. LMS18 TaxID=2924033 RepID=UPI0020D00032|nr:acylphosphatase [Evansella sp. LMS18]UTR11805.1 acylphosphatase [Evansella sp. LMS18]
MEEEKSWLQHLENAVPKEAYGYKLCMYTIALEGWRRGLDLKFFNIHNENKVKVRFSLGSGDKEFKFAVSRGSIVTSEAVRICVDKTITKEYLFKAGVSVPQGKNFTEETSDETILNYSQSLGFPLVLKPSDGGMGKGVIPNVKNEQEMKEALQYVRRDLNYKEVIVEQYVKGEDFRIYVVGDRVAGAVTRIPANVTGDGRKSINELIKIKNSERKKNPYLYSRLIKKDKELLDFIKASGYSLNSIPKQGEVVFLREKSNVSAGGDPVEITTKLTDEIKEMAVKAINAVPGLVQGAVDMVVDVENNTGVVLEINSKAQIAAHLFPEKGVAQDVPAAIIDYYFPETAGNNGSKISNYFFDFKSILTPLATGILKEVRVPPAPKYNHPVKKYVISGKVQGVGYRKWIQKNALSLKLNGYVKNLNNGKVVVVFSGRKENMANFTDIINNKSPNRAKVKEVNEKVWNKPVKMGFEIKLNENQEELSLKDENENLTKENKRLQNQYQKITQSKTWRFSYPIRRIGKLINKNK